MAGCNVGLNSAQYSPPISPWGNWGRVAFRCSASLSQPCSSLMFFPSPSLPFWRGVGHPWAVHWMCPDPCRSATSGTCYWPASWGMEHGDAHCPALSFIPLCQRGGQRVLPTDTCPRWLPNNCCRKPMPVPLCWVPTKPEVRLRPDKTDNIWLQCHLDQGLSSAVEALKAQTPGVSTADPLLPYPTLPCPGPLAPSAPIQGRDLPCQGRAIQHTRGQWWAPMSPTCDRAVVLAPLWRWLRGVQHGCRAAMESAAECQCAWGGQEPWVGDKGQISQHSLGQSTKTHRLVPHSTTLPAALREVFLEGTLHIWKTRLQRGLSRVRPPRPLSGV